MAITKTVDGRVIIDGRVTVGNLCSHGSINVHREDDTLTLSSTSENGTVVKMSASIEDIKEAVIA
jgi:hypothetical protein